jgi:hypothetical protein
LYRLPKNVGECCLILFVDSRDWLLQCPEQNLKCVLVCRLTASSQLLSHFRGEKSRLRKSIVAEFDILVLYEEYSFSFADNLRRMTLRASRIILSHTVGIKAIKPLVKLLNNLRDGSG